MSISKVSFAVVVLFAILFGLFALPMRLSSLTQKAGVVQSRPVDPAGVWIVDGQSFYVTTLTEVNDARGELVSGVCVSLHVTKKGQTYLTEKVERASPAMCSEKTTTLGQVFKASRK